MARLRLTLILDLCPAAPSVLRLPPTRSVPGAGGQGEDALLHTDRHNPRGPSSPGQGQAREAHGVGSRALGFHSDSRAYLRPASAVAARHLPHARPTPRPHSQPLPESIPSGSRPSRAPPPRAPRPFRKPWPGFHRLRAGFLRVWAPEGAALLG